MRVIIPFFAVMLLLAGCSGSTLNVTDVQQPVSEYHAPSWNPLAANAEVLPLNEALAAAPGMPVGERSILALDICNKPDTAVNAALRCEERDGALVIYSDAPLAHASLYVRYDGGREHVVSATVDRSDAVGMAIVEPGRVAVGVASIGGVDLDLSKPLATVEFAAGPETAVRRASTISEVERSAVKDLVAIYDGEGSATL